MQEAVTRWFLQWCRLAEQETQTRVVLLDVLALPLYALDAHGVLRLERLGPRTQQRKQELVPRMLGQIRPGVDRPYAQMTTGIHTLLQIFHVREHTSQRLIWQISDDALGETPEHVLLFRSPAPAGNPG